MEIDVVLLEELNCVAQVREPLIGLVLDLRDVSQVGHHFRQQSLVFLIQVNLVFVLFGGEGSRRQLLDAFAHFGKELIDVLELRGGIIQQE